MVKYYLNLVQYFAEGEYRKELRMGLISNFIFLKLWISVCRLSVLQNKAVTVRDQFIPLKDCSGVLCAANSSPSFYCTLALS